MSKMLDIQNNDHQIIEPMEEELVKYHPLDSKKIFCQILLNYLSFIFSFIYCKKCTKSKWFKAW